MSERTTDSDGDGTVDAFDPFPNDPTRDGSGGGGGGGEGGDDGSSLLDFDVPTSLSDLLPTAQANVLVAFAKQPKNFVLGAVLTAILEGVSGIVTTVIDAIWLVVAGRGPAIGLADIPTLVVDAIFTAAEPAGSAIIGAITGLNEPLFAAAAQTGPLAPVATTAVIAGETLVVLAVGERVLAVALDLIPGGGGLT